MDKENLKSLNIVICCFNDYTSSLIFEQLIYSPYVNVKAIIFQAGYNSRDPGLLKGAIKHLKKMSKKYWLYLVLINGMFLFISYVNSKLSQPIKFNHRVTLKVAAKINKIPIYLVEDWNSQPTIDLIKSYNPEIILIRIGAILGSEFIDLANIGVYCIHSSVLPKYKGIAAEFHASRNNDRSIGTTIFRVNSDLDAGPIIAQQCIITKQEFSVFKRMLLNNLLASRLLEQTMGNIFHMQEEFKNNKYKIKITQENSYFGWPTKENMKELRKRKIPVFEINDFFEIFNCTISE